MKKLLLLAVVATKAFAAEQYIVPVVASTHPNAPYWSTLALTSAFNTTVRVKAIYPLDAIACPVNRCIGISQISVFGGYSTVISDMPQPLWFTIDDHTLMKLGAVLLESDVPLVVESEAYRAGYPARDWQPVQVARQFVSGETQIERAIFSDASTNLFLVNPNDSALRISYWSDHGGRGETMVAAGRSALVVLPANFDCPGGCGSGEIPRGLGFTLHLQADLPYLAATSSKSTNLPPIVRVTRPLQ